MKRIRRRNLVIAAAAAVAAGGGGAAIAATQFDSPSARSNAIVKDAASQLGVTPEALSGALRKAEENQIDADVAAGRLTKEQGDALKAAIESGKVPVLGFGPGLGLGHHGFGMLGAGLDAAADYLGLSRADLLSQLRSGKTLADVARDRGKSVDGLVTALVNAVETQLDARVADGSLTKEQEQAIESNLKDRITKLVNGERGALPGPGRGPGFRRFGGSGFLPQGMSPTA